MQERLIDLTLLLSLALIAIIVAFALLNVGRRAPVRVAAEQDVALEAAADTGVVPIRVGRDTAVAAEPAGQAAAPAEAAPEATEPPPQAQVSLTRGTVALERVGFSYTTGGAGACGITLEPWRHIAASRDLLAEHGCGAEVTIELAEPVGGHQSFTAVIADTMSPSFSSTVNIYISPDEPAFEYGVLDEGTLTAQSE